MAREPVDPPRPPFRLYMNTPTEIADLSDITPELDEALAAGDVAALQIRLKDTPLDEVRRIAKVLAPVARPYGTAVLMNDFVELAKELGLDGAHVGQSDMAYREARRILGPDAMIGVTCHNSRHLAMEAGEAGAAGPAWL